MAIIDVDTVKVFLQIPATNTAKDDLIEALIPEIQGDIIEWCNNDFVDPDTKLVVWPAGIKLPAAMMIGYAMSEMAGGGSSIGLQSESQGGYSYTRSSGQNTDGEYPESILKKLEKWKYARALFSTVQSQSRDSRGLNEHELAEDEYLQGGVDGVPYANQ